MTTRPDLRAFVKRQQAEAAGQLALFREHPLVEPGPWRLSPLTRWNGRVGIAACRAVLAKAKKQAA